MYIMISSSMFMLGDFYDWDFYDIENDTLCTTSSVVRTLQDYAKSSDPIVSKKAKRALYYMLYMTNKIHVMYSDKPLINLAKKYDSVLYVADVGEYLYTRSDLTEEEKERCILYTPKDKESIPHFNAENWYCILNPETEKKNPLNLKINQYFTIKDTETKERTLFKVDSQYKYIPVPYQTFKSTLYGETKPKKDINGFTDCLQLAAIDSLKNNQLTMLTGKAGTGKSYLAIAALLEKLQKHEIDKIYIFCNPVATRDSAKLGFEVKSK